MRAAFFLVPLVLAMLMVLLCAFLIPCQKAERQPQWERPVGEAGGNLSHLSEGELPCKPGIWWISKMHCDWPAQVSLRQRWPYGMSTGTQSKMFCWGRPNEQTTPTPSREPKV